MSDRFAVEADRSVVGVAVRAPGGFRFFASNPDYRKLDGRIFRRAAAVVRRVQELAASKRRAAARERRAPN